MSQSRLALPNNERPTPTAARIDDADEADGAQRTRLLARRRPRARLVVVCNSGPINPSAVVGVRAIDRLHVFQSAFLRHEP